MGNNRRKRPEPIDDNEQPERKGKNNENGVSI